jgi:hypothetical protein
VWRTPIPHPHSGQRSGSHRFIFFAGVRLTVAIGSAFWISQRPTRNPTVTDPGAPILIAELDNHAVSGIPAPSNDIPPRHNRSLVMFCLSFSSSLRGHSLSKKAPATKNTAIYIKVAPTKKGPCRPLSCERRSAPRMQVKTYRV